MRKVTRGHGVLESFLAKKRCAVADKLIPLELRKGRLLDIGCGNYPIFLLNTEFKEKYGVEKLDYSSYDRGEFAGISITNFDVSCGKELPFDDEYFSAVTMLAVVEHLECESAVQLLDEVHRVLMPGGVLVITTPARWTAGMLKAMSRLGLVSSEEIADHKEQYSRNGLRALFEKTGFSSGKLKIGSFELFANLWALAVR